MDGAAPVPYFWWHTTSFLALCLNRNLCVYAWQAPSLHLLKHPSTTGQTADGMCEGCSTSPGAVMATLWLKVQNHVPKNVFSLGWPTCPMIIPITEERDRTEKERRASKLSQVIFPTFKYGGGNVGITFNVNFQVLIDIYMDKWGFSLSFKPKFTVHITSSIYRLTLQTAEKILIHVEIMSLPTTQVLQAQTSWLCKLKHICWGQHRCRVMQVQNSPKAFFCS